MSMARRLALHRQGLDGRWDPPAGKEGIAQTIERIGYVQIDTIAVVERAHHHTLWARHPEYDQQTLHELQAEDRRIFEWWAPAMSYVPMRDYRFYAVRMDGHRSWHRKWYTENVEFVAQVLERVREEGPLGSADFKPPDDFKRGTWWSWKPSKRALEALFDMGEVMVTERRNFQRIYDLTERVLPPGLDITRPTRDELARFEARRTLGNLGFAEQGNVKWGRWGKKAVPEDVVRGLVETGEVTPFEIKGIEDQSFYALTRALETVAELPAESHRVHILSPFDNLIINRGWLKRYFDFDYKLEAYTPKAKRKYGYFTLPILWGEQLVGRMDAKADRKPKTFVIRNLVFEPHSSEIDALFTPLTDKLWAFAAFNGCERFTVERVVPEEYKAPLETALTDSWVSKRTESVS
jgi:uncharacterized protein YcaQ